MPEEAKQNPEVKEQEADTPSEKSGKGGMLKYIIFGVGALVVVVVLTVAALYFLSGDTTADSATESSGESAEVTPERLRPELPAPAGSDEQVAMTGETGDGPDDLGLEEEDASAIEKIMENLAFLDYEPDENEMAEQEGRMSKSDSIEQVNWLEKEKAALALREKELKVRQRDLDRLEKEVNKKVLNLEQAESARTAQLAKLYDGMDSRAVAKLLANLDDQTVVSILPRMKLKNASAALQLMPAQRAAKLSKQMITIAGK